jgi:hypothetical protein
MLDVIAHRGKQVDDKITAIIAMLQRREGNSFFRCRRRGAIRQARINSHDFLQDNGHRIGGTAGQSEVFAFFLFPFLLFLGFSRFVRHFAFLIFAF